MAPCWVPDRLNRKVGQGAHESTIMEPFFVKGPLVPAPHFC